MYFYFSWIGDLEISSKMGIGFSWDQNWILYEFISNMAVLKILPPVPQSSCFLISYGTTVLGIKNDQ